MSKDRCHARDGYGQRCTVVGEHTEITNSKDQRALAHETKTSMWSTPVSNIQVIGGRGQGSILTTPDFAELAHQTPWSPGEWGQAWDALSRKELWPHVCKLVLDTQMTPVDAAVRLGKVVPW